MATPMATVMALAIATTILAMAAAMAMAMLLFVHACLCSTRLSLQCTRLSLQYMLVLAVQWFTRLSLQFDALHFTFVSGTVFTSVFRSVLAPGAGKGPPAAPRGRSVTRLGMASDPSWMAGARRRLQEAREDVAASGVPRWRELGDNIQEQVRGAPPSSVERSRLMLDVVRKDMAMTKLQFDPQRFTLVVEGRPVQVLVAHRLLGGIWGTFPSDRGALRPRGQGLFPLAGPFLKSRHVPRTFSRSLGPWASFVTWHAQVLALTHEDASWTEQLPYMAARWSHLSSSLADMSLEWTYRVGPF
jgi:hypothetical protein